MVSGHYDSSLSAYASKYLIKEVDIQVSAVIAKNLNILGDAIPDCLVDTIEKFDATLHSAMIAKMREIMETRTVKPPKALPNTFRKVMPTLVVANKHSQGKKDLGDPKYIRLHTLYDKLYTQ